MSTPIDELDKLKYPDNNTPGPADPPSDPPDPPDLPEPPKQSREQANRLDDDLAVLQVERQISQKTEAASSKQSRSVSLRTSSRRGAEPVDEFDVATNPLHEQTAKYQTVQDPTTTFAKFFIKVHNSSFLVRYFTYITPGVLVFLIPLLVGALAYPDAHVGGVELMWFAIWLEIFWLTLWAGRIVAKCIPPPVGIVASLFTNNQKKWRDLAKQLELPAALFFWFLAVEISFLPTMTNHHVDGTKGAKEWEVIVNKIIIAFFVFFTLNFIEKIIIQLIAISFHLRTYADRIEINKFQIGSLTKLYAHSRSLLAMDDRDFEESGETTRSSGAKTPMQYADNARRVAKSTLNRIGDVAGAVAGDFTGREVVKSNHPHQVVITLLSTTSGSQVLARRMYRTFAKDGFDTVFPGDLKSAFDNSEEAEAAFAMFDKDMNGDISMEELEAVCVEIGRERKSITASLKDLDSVVEKLDDVFMFFVVIIAILVLISLISTSAAGVLTSAGSALLALSWLFSATAQEMLASIIFVFVKHPFDVGDRVTVYGNSGDNMQGDDYYVKEIALFYTEFKKMQGHVVQAPNSYLNTLFILNQRRSGPLAEAVPVIIKFGTTLQQIEHLRHRLLEFVRSEKREFDGNILTELREVTENYSITLNVVFFYKSNWQNELLRLQRRNKFICNLMLCLQDVGIEGPRMNLAGFHDTNPMFLAHQGAPPQYSSLPTDPNDPESQDTVGDLGPSNPQHGILRTRANTGSLNRRRDAAAARKHVDFSLGMKDMSHEDPTGDVFDDRTSRVKDVMRTANCEATERRMAERREEEAERASASQGRGSNDTLRTGASTSIAEGQGSTRNRFLPRMSRSTRDERSPSGGPSMRLRSNDNDEHNLMEQGRVSNEGLSPYRTTASGRSGSVPSSNFGWAAEPPHVQSQEQRRGERERPVEMSEYTHSPRPQ